MRYRSLVRSEQPVIEPVSLAEAKSHLRIDSDAEDSLIQNLISSARAWAEDYTDRTFIRTQWTMRLDSFYGPVGSPVQFGLKADGNNIEGRQGTVPNLDIELPRPPAIADGTITITYVPYAGASAVLLASTDYRTDLYATPAVVRPLYGKTWPGHLVDQNSVTVTYYAGYGADPINVPPPAKSAVLMLVAHLWRNREMTADAALTEVPFGVRSMLDTIRWGSYR